MKLQRYISLNLVEFSPAKEREKLVQNFPASGFLTDSDPDLM